METDEDLLL